MDLFTNKKIIKYYSKDYNYYKISNSYVIPKVNSLFNNLLITQKFLFILAPANGGSSVIASLIDSSINTSFSPNYKYEGLLNINPAPNITHSHNWYNINFKPDYNLE